MKKSAVMHRIALVALTLCLASCGLTLTVPAIKVTTRAEQWAAKASLTGARVSCTAFDPDGDGYVTCTVSHAGGGNSIECPKAGRAGACRLYGMKR